MGLLRTGVAFIAVAAFGCYEPTLRDCTLTCTAPSDCADGQVCGSDRLCAAPEIAGRCSSLPGNAGSTDRDAGIDAATLPDARPDAAPDAATHVPIAISIEGQGRVTVQGIGNCDKSGPQNGSCMFLVPVQQVITTQAQPYEGQRFDKWTTPICQATTGTSCTFVSASPVSVGVKFRKDD